MVRSPSGRARGTSEDRTNNDGEDDDDDEEYQHNLTFDGVKVGPYMICKHSDDLLGHHARQVFRAKAASMRGENSIYYYLKDLMKKFGAHNHKKGLTSEQLVLDAHEFRKLVASDPAFQCAIPEDQVDALFHRIEHDDHKVIRHIDFVEFCLLDHNQLRLLLYKFRKCLKRMRLSDNEITDTFKRLTSNGSATISHELLHAAITRELDVVLTTGELYFMTRLMDFDEDGVVKVNDFEMLVKDDRASYNLVHPVQENAVVDLKITVNDAEEVTLKRDSYVQMYPPLQQEASTKMHLWYKTAPREDGKSAITNIRYAPTARDTDLVSKGFTCLQQDVNRSGAFGKHKYVWLSYVPPGTQHISEVIGLSLSSGELDDQKDARLWLPMHRGFKLVHGNLNEKSSKHGVFLWIRRRTMLDGEGLVDSQVPESPRTRTKIRMHVDELEDQVRRALRRKCPVDQDGALNFSRLFEEFDHKKTRAIGKQATLVGLGSFGIKMNTKDFSLIWERMNPPEKKSIDVLAFSMFLEMTDADIDELVSGIQRSMIRSSQQMPNYRTVFQSYNSLGDGRFSRSDFQRLFATIQVVLTNSELSRVIQRFDTNKDGVVDYSDFLRFITGVCDASTRRAQRIADAAEELKTWALERQNKKLAKDGNIDSTAAWKLLRPKRGIVEVGSIDHILRQRNLRLSPAHLKLLKVVMAPATNGEVNQASFHAFVNHLPRKITSMVYDMKKVLGAAPNNGDQDTVFDRLNVEGNGKLSLITFLREVNGLASEKTVTPFDLKDFVYLVQWAGADCGGDGAVVIDRFLAVIRENKERRNMKHEFVTHYDSPRFVEGVKLLREEIRRCAKTPDGKFNYMVPFRQFDKDHSGQILLSEFELAVRELGVDKYLSDQEIKSLMRRFDLNASGGVNFEEFLRFNVADSSAPPKPGAFADVRHVLHDIILNEQLTPLKAQAYCTSLKRMFAIIDKDTHGVIPCDRFVQTLRDMGITPPTEDLEALVVAFAGDSEDEIRYGEFCGALQHLCEHDESERSLHPPPVELMDLIQSIFLEYQDAKRKYAELGKPHVTAFQAFGITDEEHLCVAISPDEIKEVLWATGVRHPYLREELESILKCFEAQPMMFNVIAFCRFMEEGPSVFFQENTGVLDGYIARLQEDIRSYLSSGKDAEERLLHCFAEFDEDGNGSISSDEFLKVLQKAGLRHFLAPDDESLLLRFLDIDGDGVIAFNDFVEFARHADQRLVATVAHSDDLPPPSPSPPGSPPKSPAKSATSPVKSTKSQPGPPNARPSPSPSSPRPSDAAPLMSLIGRLNRKLQAPFPFDKYFKKYQVNGREPIVKARVFGKIVDKFLARLIENRIPYDMQVMDPDSLTRAYAARSDCAAVNFEIFLMDLKKSQTTKSGWSSDSSDSSEGDLSCSSDEGESGRKSGKAAPSLMKEVIKRYYKTAKDQEAFRAKLKDCIPKMEKYKKDKASDKKVYKILVLLGLRMHKTEVQPLMSYLASSSNGKVSYDTVKLGTLLNEQLTVLLGAEKKPEPPPAVPALKKETPVLSAALADKIYRCFLSAAQRNISGRKLLEKCDTQRTGQITIQDFQTVMRLMGCSLSDGEMTEIKSCLGNEKTPGSINYKMMVQQLAKQQKSGIALAKQPTTGAATERSHDRPMQLHRPTPIQVPPQEKIVSVKAPPAQTVTTEQPRGTMSSDECKRLDKVIRPFFDELLRSRTFDSKTIRSAFELYDIRCSGFVTADGFHAVLRKLDISLPDDIKTAVVSRFMSPASDRVDYVEFCSMVIPSISRRTSTSMDTQRSTLEDGSRALSAPIAQEATRSAPLSERPSMHLSLPSLGYEAHSKAIDTRSAVPPVLPTASREGWSCPVCFHTQTKATGTCEICAAQNPASVQYEMLLQCNACAFRNRSTASHCELCRLPLPEILELHGEKPKPTPSSRAVAPSSPKKLSVTASSYDEGWLA
ncbi:hypothetical protein Poli38472_014813 [Pythium oligandrum]|uniref:EF-hand domain-containing protein n=1 Tax=Pythium oligandrum TaxID=41045 RepID=A0A8K1CJ69_PYTOL|nr:hypothetical protein Poli38472_014813 [Pythium oligandrum]|eukprot:TMW63903.1 hypothetical protein Poli38472_014813 [Pythium oligandrum]